jgi:hypothetical protein
MKLTKELYEYIENECKKFEEKTFNDVNVNDVLYSYLHSTKETFCILNDWDEGKNNDPFWNDELNEHSAIVFLKQICKKIDNYYT